MILQAAIDVAKKLAKEGPRVAAVLKHNNTHHPAPGYMDRDTAKVKQILLITPDGRTWREATIGKEL